MWVVVMEMIVNEVWGSKEREREVLSLEKLNNFFKDVYVILMCCNVKTECLM